MRRVFLLGLLIAGGCGSEELTPVEEFESLQARTTRECGTYAYNYPPDVDAPTQLCGERPNTGCLDDALASGEVAHLVRSYIEPKLLRDTDTEPTLLSREHHYFAADGKVVWIAYYELRLDDPGWYRRVCDSISVEPIEVDGTACWHWRGNGCVWTP